MSAPDSLPAYDQDGTLITSDTESILTVTAVLAPEDRWQRRKAYTDTITYRVDEIRVRASSRRPDDLRVTFRGPRILKDGRESDRVNDDAYSNRVAAAPGHVAAALQAAVDGWKAAL